MYVHYTLCVLESITQASKGTIRSFVVANSEVAVPAHKLLEAVVPARSFEEVCVSVVFETAVGAGVIVTDCSDVVEESVLALEVTVEGRFGDVVAV